MPLVAANSLQPAFWWYVVINAFVGLMNAAINTLIDSTAVAMLGDQRHKYGLYRLGGSIGFIVGAVGAGQLYDRVGYGWMFARHIEQADSGCDFDFLRRSFGSSAKEPDIY